MTINRTSKAGLQIRPGASTPKLILNTNLGMDWRPAISTAPGLGQNIQNNSRSVKDQLPSAN